MNVNIEKRKKGSTKYWLCIVFALLIIILITDSYYKINESGQLMEDQIKMVGLNEKYDFSPFSDYITSIVDQQKNVFTITIGAMTLFLTIIGFIAGYSLLSMDRILDITRDVNNDRDKLMHSKRDIQQDFEQIESKLSIYSTQFTRIDKLTKAIENIHENCNENLERLSIYEIPYDLDRIGYVQVYNLRQFINSMTFAKALGSKPTDTQEVLIELFKFLEVIFLNDSLKIRAAKSRLSLDLSILRTGRIGRQGIDLPLSLMYYLAGSKRIVGLSRRWEYLEMAFVICPVNEKAMSEYFIARREIEADNFSNLNTILLEVYNSIVISDEGVFDFATWEQSLVDGIDSWIANYRLFWFLEFLKRHGVGAMSIESVELDNITRYCDDNYLLDSSIVYLFVYFPFYVVFHILEFLESIADQNKLSIADVGRVAYKLFSKAESGLSKISKLLSVSDYFSLIESRAQVVNHYLSAFEIYGMDGELPIEYIDAGRSLIQNGRAFKWMIDVTDKPFSKLLFVTSIKSDIKLIWND